MEGSLLINKGIVIEVKKNYGIVLSDEGVYEKVVKKGSLSEGDRIIYTREDIYEGKQAGRKKVYRGLFSAAMVIFAIAMAFGFEKLPSQNVYAVVSMDINPSIQYYLDKDNFVIRAEAMNEDGRDIADCGLEGLSIEKAINRTLEEAEKTHYLKADSKVIVSAADLKSGKAGYAEQIAGKIFEEPMIAQKQIEVFVLEVDREDYEESKTMETSLGKYKVYEICGEGAPFSLEEINGMKASEIIENSLIDEEKVRVFKSLAKDGRREISQQSNHTAKTPEKAQSEEMLGNVDIPGLSGHKKEKVSMKADAAKDRKSENGKTSEKKNDKTALGGNEEIADMTLADGFEDVLSVKDKKEQAEVAFAGLAKKQNEKKVEIASSGGNKIKIDNEETGKAVKDDATGKSEKQSNKKVAKVDDFVGPSNIASGEKTQTDSSGGNKIGFKKENSLKAADGDGSGGLEKKAKEKVAKTEKNSPSSNADIESLPKNQASKENSSGGKVKDAEPDENRNEEIKNDKKNEKVESERGKKVKLIAMK